MEDMPSKDFHRNDFEQEICRLKAHIENSRNSELVLVREVPLYLWCLRLRQYQPHRERTPLLAGPGQPMAGLRSDLSATVLVVL